MKVIFKIHINEFYLGKSFPKPFILTKSFNKFHPKDKKTPEPFLKNLYSSTYVKTNNFAFHIDIMEQLKWKLWILLNFQKTAAAQIQKDQLQLQVECFP